MKSKWLKYSLIIGVSVLIFAYFCVMIFNANISTDSVVETQYATRITYDEYISADCIVVRDETLLSYNTDKTLFYTVDDGDTVGVNSTVAYVFSDEADALNHKRMKEIEDEIDMLQELNSASANASADHSTLDKQIELDVKNVIASVTSASYADVEDYGESVVYNINRRQVITGGVDNFSNKISSLESELATLKQNSASYSDIVSNGNDNGYFVSYVDGYEELYDFDSVLEMTVADFPEKTQAADVSDAVIGKIVSGPNWYVVCKLTADEALTLSHSNAKITLNFKNTSSENIPATLATLNQSGKQSDAVAIFQCNYMNSSLSYLRNETVQIVVNSYTGIKISKDAIHDDYVNVDDSETEERKKVQGVYVLRGSELVFKEISILYAGNDFVIIDEEPEIGKLVSGETVLLNDSVVVMGDNLYAGKVVK